jgi:hypothetical protein
VLDDAAAIGFVAMMALGEGRIAPVDGLILTALVLSGAAMFDRLPDETKKDLRAHFPVTAAAGRRRTPRSIWRS